MIQATGGTTPSRDTYTRPIRDDIERLEEMRDLFKTTHNQARIEQIDKILAQRREQLVKAAEGPREFSAECQAAIAAYLDRAADLPASFPNDLRRPVEAFRTLSDHGVLFSSPDMKDMEPAAAFMQLERHVWHAPDEQVMFRTYEGGNIVLSTLRPEYLESLVYYLDETKNGQVFYAEKKGGFVRIDRPGDFLEAYKDDPKQARIKAIDGSYLPVEEARKREAEWARKLLTINGQDVERPKVEDLGETISIGGVVVRKRK